MPKVNVARRTSNEGHMGERGAGPQVPDHAVLRRMYQLLEESEPSVGVDADLIEVMRRTVENIINGHAISASDLASDISFEALFRYMTGRGDAKCGIRLLSFMGHLCQALWEQGPATLSIAKAIELMTVFQDVIHLRFGHSGARWWIESTAEGTKAFGAPIRIEIPKEPPLSDLRLLGAFRDLAGDGSDDESDEYFDLWLRP